MATAPLRGCHIDMQRYKNVSRESGVVAYEIGRGSITVKFVGGEIYIYTDESAGAENVARMQRLAEDGAGLSTFISQHVHDRYARKR
jgi:hypothetical protein